MSVDEHCVTCTKYLPLTVKDEGASETINVLRRNMGVIPERSGLVAQWNLVHKLVGAGLLQEQVVTQLTTA
jgi:hypothetical protein